MALTDIVRVVLEMVLDSTATSKGRVSPCVIADQLKSHRIPPSPFPLKNLEQIYLFRDSLSLRAKAGKNWLSAAQLLPSLKATSRNGAQSGTSQ